MKIEPLQPGTYVLAVSGGIDSMVMLDCLINARIEGVHFVIAHVDHGIRPDAQEDLLLVKQVAIKHSLTFETTHLFLGEDASEDHARVGRHAFLQKIKRKYSALAIITAHHRDDVVETAIINLQRGTGWRGIASLRNTLDYIRPLLACSKEDIRVYARSHNLIWRDDSTNKNMAYKRNYVRHQVIPFLTKNDPDFLECFYTLIKDQLNLRAKIEKEINDLSRVVIEEKGPLLGLYRKLDISIAVEVLRCFLKTQDISLTRPQLTRLHFFMIRAHRNQKHSLGKNLFARRNEGLLVVEKG